MSEPDNGYAKTISVELFFILLSIKGAYPSEKYLHCKRGLLPCGNDTSAQPQSERITIQGSRKSIAFVGKESNRLISDAFAERQNEPKGELRTPSQAMSAVRAEPGR